MFGHNIRALVTTDFRRLRTQLDHLDLYPDDDVDCAPLISLPLQPN